MKEPPSRSGPRPIAPTSFFKKLIERVRRAFTSRTPGPSRPERQSASELRSLTRDLMAAGETDAAIRACQNLLARHPDDASVAKRLGDLLAPRDRKHAAVSYVGAAIINGKQGHTRQAQAQLMLAIALDPELADAHYRLGDYLAGNGEIPKALEAYRTALRLHEAHDNPEQATRVRELIAQVENFFPLTRKERTS